jgi:hypothetical protein
LKRAVGPNRNGMGSRQTLVESKTAVNDHS